MSAEMLDDKSQVMKLSNSPPPLESQLMQQSASLMPQLMQQSAVMVPQLMQQPGGLLGPHYQQQMTPVKAEGGGCVGGDLTPNSVVRTRRRKAGLSEDERICVVCGDPASGYNFDRLTCESCKAFFRRNALKAPEKIKPCSRGGGCDISGAQRKHCPTCRLHKCLEAGMKKELILPPEKLQQRAKPKRRPRYPQQQQQQQQQLMQSGSGRNAGVDLDPPLLGDQRQSGCRLPELAQSWATTTHAGQSWARELTDADQECLDNLKEALARVRETLVLEGGNLNQKDGVGRLEQAFNQMDACIRRIISVVKLIPIFCEVEKDSQILMLKVNIYGLVILYSSFFFNAATGGWEMPVSQQSECRRISLMQELASSVAAIIEMRPEVSDLTLSDLEQYKANTENVYRQLELCSRGDDLVKMLMLALKLFNSDTMPAGVRDCVDRAQSIYSLLLQKYLAYRFGVADAMQMYPRLLLTFIDMRTVENKMTDFTKLLSVESLNPLVREVTERN